MCRREETLTVKRGRIEWIDALKGFAMFCIVLGHVTHGYLAANLFPQHEVLIRSLDLSMYAFHLTLFFALSGFLFFTAYCEDGGLRIRGGRLKRQVFDLIAVYFLYSILLWVVKYLMGDYANGGVTVQDLLLIWGKPISPYWYLYALLELYAIFSIRGLNAMKFRHLFPLLFVIGAVFFPSAIQVVNWFEVIEVLAYAEIFYLGMCWARSEHIPAGCSWAIRISGIAGFIVGGGIIARGVDTREIPVVGLFVAIAISMLLFHTFERVPALGENKLLCLIGRYSLEIYVLHVFFTAGFRTVFSKLGISNVYVSILLNFVLSTAIPLCGAWIAKKMKIHDLLFKPYTYFKRILG